jgi:hypothetical protein
MKVKADRAVRYNGESYAAGQEFDMTREDYEQHKDILTITCDENPPAQKPAKSEEERKPENDLVNLSVVRLKEIAKEKNVQGCEKMTKAKLIAALEALEADVNGGPGDSEKPSSDPAAGQE